MVKGTFEWEMRGQKYKDTDDTDSTDDFKKHFAYICAYTYARKSLEITVSSVSVFRERFENVRVDAKRLIFPVIAFLKRSSAASAPSLFR